MRAVILTIRLETTSPWKIHSTTTHPANMCWSRSVEYGECKHVVKDPVWKTRCESKIKEIQACQKEKGEEEAEDQENQEQGEGHKCGEKHWCPKSEWEVDTWEEEGFCPTCAAKMGLEAHLDSEE
jgi:hypothetical protein